MNQRRLVLRFVIFSVLVLSINILLAQQKVKSVTIISKINDSNYNDLSKIASIDDSLKMSFVIVTEKNGITRYYSDIDHFELDGKVIRRNSIGKIKDLSADIQISWFKIEEAKGDSYDNCSPNWHWEEIPYKETLITEWHNKSIIIPDVKPTIFTPVYCNKKITGTMRFKVAFNLNQKTYSSEGKESKYKGAISEKVHRISLKGNTGNEVINFAFSMCNLPYIWGSASFSNNPEWDNQAERFIGADCADFAVAAHQLAGEQIAYDSIKKLINTKIVSTIKYISNGNYLDENKEKIKVGKGGVQVGDFVYWEYNQPGSGHVGLYFQDRSDPSGSFNGKADGLFNEWDLVIHTLFHEPEVKSIGSAYSGGIRIYRFNNKE